MWVLLRELRPTVVRGYGTYLLLYVFFLVSTSVTFAANVAAGAQNVLSELEPSLAAPSFGVSAPSAKHDKDDPSTQLSNSFKSLGSWGTLRRNKTSENIQVSMEMEPEATVREIVPSKAPFYGNVPVEIRGTNFGKFQMKQRAFVGGTECISTIWRSEDHLTCMVPPGTGQNLDVTVKILESEASSANEDVGYTVFGDAGSSGAKFSYVEGNPYISQVVPNAGATQGGEKIEVYGSNLGTPDLPPEIRICGKSCTPVEWVDAEHVLCVTPPNTAGVVCNVTMGLGGGPELITPGLLFQYTPTAIHKISPSHGPTYGNTTVHIFGTGLGNVLSPPAIFLGPWPCQAVTFVTSSHVICSSSAASPGVVPVRVSLNGVAVAGKADDDSGCGPSCGFEFRYEPPIVESVSPNIVSVFGNDTISIYGRNLGFQFLAQHPRSREIIDAYALDYPAARVTVNGLPCLQTTQVSESHVQCVTPPLPAGSYAVVVTVLDQPSRSCGRCSDSCATCLTYHAPFVSTAYPARGPVYGGFEIFLHGRMFGSGALSQVAFLGSRPCNHTRWISSSELACLVPAGIPAGSARVTVSSSVHLGHEDYAYRIGPDGKFLMNGGYSGSTAAEVQFEVPRVTRILPSQGPTSGGSIITVSGRYFGRWSRLLHPKQLAGQDRGLPRVFVGDNECLDVAAVPLSDMTATDAAAAVTCRVPPNSPGPQPVSVVVSGMTESTRPRHPCTRLPSSADGVACSYFTYEGPYVDVVRPSFGPFYGGSQISITGRNFGKMQQVVHVRVGGLPCSAVKRVDENTVTCKTPPSSPGRATVDIIVSHADLGNGNNIPSSYSNAAQVGTSGGRLAFVYEAPTVDRVLPSFGPASGGSKISIFGSNFGGPSLTDHPTEVYFGAARCSNVKVVTSTEISCVAPMPPPISPESISFASSTVANLATPLQHDITHTTLRHGQPSNLALAVPVRVVVGGESSRTDYQDGDVHNVPGRRVGRDVLLPSVKPEHTPRRLIDNLFFYHGPQIRSIEPSAGAVFGGDTLTITGHFFSPPAATSKDASGGGGPDGVNLPKPVVFFDDSYQCDQVQVVSDSVLKCVVPAVEKPLTATLRVSLAGLSSSSVGYGIHLWAEMENLYVSRSPVSSELVTHVAPRDAATVASLEVSAAHPPSLRLLHLPGGYDVIQYMQHTTYVESQSRDRRLSVTTGPGPGTCCCCAFQFKFEPPIVQFVSPDHLSSAGGESITIRGRHFAYSTTSINEKPKAKPMSDWRNPAAVAQVSVGGNLCSDLKVVSSNEIRCRAAPQAPGWKSLEVFVLGYRAVSAARAFATGPLGSSTASLRSDNEMQSFSNGDMVRGGDNQMPQVLVVGPSARVVIPNTGSFLGGQMVTILGSGFGQPRKHSEASTNAAPNLPGTLTVFFGTSECKSVVHVSSTELQCVTTAGSIGSQRVTVSNSGYSNNAANTATFAYEGPFVSHVMPSEGASYGGTAITIVGRNLGHAKDEMGRQVIVTVGGKPCLSASWNNKNDPVRKFSPWDAVPRKRDPTSLVCITPFGVGAAEIAVRSHGVAAASDEGLYFQYVPPQVRQVVPAQGPAHGHTHIRVYGSNFGQQTLFPTVYIGGQKCLRTTFISSSELECLSPPANITAEGYSIALPMQTRSVMISSTGCNDVAKLGRKAHVAVAVMDAALSDGATDPQHPRLTAGSTFSLSEMDDDDLRTNVESDGSSAFFLYEPMVVSSVQPSMCSLSNVLSGQCVIQVHGRNLGVSVPGESDAVAPSIRVGDAICSNVVLRSPNIAECTVGVPSSLVVDTSSIEMFLAGDDSDSTDSVVAMPVHVNAIGIPAVTLTQTSECVREISTAIEVHQTSFSCPHNAHVATAKVGCQLSNPTCCRTTIDATSSIEFSFDAGGSATLEPAVGTFGGHVQLSIRLKEPASFSMLQQYSVFLHTTVGGGLAKCVRPKVSTIEGIPTLRCLAPSISRFGLQDWQSEESLQVSVSVFAHSSTSGHRGLVKVADCPNCFEYQAPTITSLSPASGGVCGGETLTITGQQFPFAQKVPTNVRTEVWIGSKQCIDVQVHNSTMIRCRSPRNALLGEVPVQVRLVASTAPASTFESAAAWLQSKRSCNMETHAKLPTFQYERPIVITVAPAKVPAYGMVPLNILGKNFGPKTVPGGASADDADNDDKCGVKVVVGGLLCGTPKVTSISKVLFDSGVLSDAGPILSYARARKENWMQLECIAPAHDSGGFKDVHVLTDGVFAVNAKEKAKLALMDVEESLQNRTLNTNATSSPPPPPSPSYSVPRYTASIPQIIVPSEASLSASVLSFGAPDDELLEVQSFTVEKATPVLPKQPVGRVMYDLPHVDDVSPAHGLLNMPTKVNVTGRNFGTAQMPTPRVFFGATPCRNVVRINTSFITCTVPPRLVPIAQNTSSDNDSVQSAFPVTVAVQGQPKSTGKVHFFRSASDAFETRTPVYSIERPFISGVTPSEGRLFGGTLLTISGEHFVASLPANLRRAALPLRLSETDSIAVFVGQQKCSSLTLVSDTQITCVTPAYLEQRGPSTASQSDACGMSWMNPTRQTSTRNVQVRLAVGGVLSAETTEGNGTNSFRYTPTPPIRIVSATRGHIFGGYQLALAGGLPILSGASTMSIKELQAPSLRVYVGGSLCTSPQLSANGPVNNTVLSCTVPPHVPAATTVRVFAMGFVIDAAPLFIFDGPSVSAVTPNFGFADQAYKLELSGHNFQPKSRAQLAFFGLRANDAWFDIRIGNELCQNVSIVSDTQLSCVYPGPLTRSQRMLDAAASSAFSFVADAPMVHLPVKVELSGLCHDAVQNDINFTLKTPFVSHVSVEGEQVRPYGGENMVIKGFGLADHATSRGGQLVDFRYQIFLDNTPCKATQVVDANSIRCIGIPPLLRPMRAKVGLGFVVAKSGESNRTFDSTNFGLEEIIVIDQPHAFVDVGGFSVSSVEPASAIPGSTINIYGSGFPAQGTALASNVSITIGSRLCDTTVLVNSTTLQCVGVPLGTGSNLVVTVIVAGVPTIPGVTDSDDPQVTQDKKSPFFSYPSPTVTAIGSDGPFLTADGTSTVTLAVRQLSRSNLRRQFELEKASREIFNVSGHNSNVLLLWSHEELDVGDWPIVVSASTGTMRVCNTTAELPVSAMARETGERRIACTVGFGWGDVFVTMLPAAVVEALLALGPEQVFNGADKWAMRWDRERYAPKSKDKTLLGGLSQQRYKDDARKTLASLRRIVGNDTKIASMSYAPPEVVSISSDQVDLPRSGGARLTVHGRNFGAPVDAAFDAIRLHSRLTSGLSRLKGPELELAIADVLSVVSVRQLEKIVEQHQWRPLRVSYTAMRKYEDSVRDLGSVRFAPRPLAEVTPPATPVCGNVSEYKPASSMWQHQYRSASTQMRNVMQYKHSMDAAVCTIWTQAALVKQPPVPFEDPGDNGAAERAEFVSDVSSVTRLVQQDVVRHQTAAAFRHTRRVSLFDGSVRCRHRSNTSNSTAAESNDSEPTILLELDHELQRDDQPQLALPVANQLPGLASRHMRATPSLMFLQKTSAVVRRQNRIWPSEMKTTTAPVAQMQPLVVNETTQMPTDTTVDSTPGFETSTPNTTPDKLNETTVDAGGFQPTSTLQAVTTSMTTDMPSTTAPTSMTTSAVADAGDIVESFPVDNRYYSQGALVLINGAECPLDAITVNELHCRSPPGSGKAAGTSVVLDTFEMRAQDLSFAGPRIIQVYPTSALPGDWIFVVVPGPSKASNFSYSELGVTIGGAACLDIREWGPSAATKRAADSSVEGIGVYVNSEQHLVLQCRVPRAFIHPVPLSEANVRQSYAKMWFGDDTGRSVPAEEQRLPSSLSDPVLASMPDENRVHPAVVALIDGQTSPPWRKFEYAPPILLDAIVLPSNERKFASLVDVFQYLNDFSTTPQFSHFDASSGVKTKELVASQGDFILFLGQGLKPFAASRDEAASNISNALSLSARAMSVSLNIGLGRSEKVESITGLWQSRCLPAITASDVDELGLSSTATMMQHVYRQLLRRQPAAPGSGTRSDPFDVVVCQVPVGRGTQLPLSISTNGKRTRQFGARAGTQVIFSYAPPLLSHVAVFNPSDFADASWQPIQNSGSRGADGEVGPSSGMHLLAVGRNFGSKNLKTGATVLKMIVNGVPALQVRRFSFEQLITAIERANQNVTQRGRDESTHSILTRWLRTHFHISDGNAESLLAWASSDWIHAILPPLPVATNGGDLSVYVEVGHRASNVLRTPQLHLRLAKPIVTKCTPSIGEPGDTLLLEGENFGGSSPDRTGKALTVYFVLGNTSRVFHGVAVQWHSDSALQVKVPDGFGVNLKVFVDVAMPSGTEGSVLSEHHFGNGGVTFSYRPPVVASLSLLPVLPGPAGPDAALRRMASSGSLSVRAGDTLLITGSGFGPADTGVQAFVSTKLCAMTSRISATEIKCVVGKGTGRHLSVRVRIGDLTTVALPGTVSAPFAETTLSYPSPTISTVTPAAIPTLGGTLLTVHGDFLDDDVCNDAVHGKSFLVSIGLRPCPVQQCTGHSTLTCIAPPGVGRNNRALVWVPTNVRTNDTDNIQSQLVGFAQTSLPRGKHAPRVSYLPPCVDNVRASKSTATTILNTSAVHVNEGDWIIVHGQNFGDGDATPLVLVGGRPCVQTIFVNDSTIKCAVPAAHRLSDMDSSQSIRNRTQRSLRGSGARGPSTNSLPVSVVVAGQSSSSLSCTGVQQPHHSSVQYNSPFVTAVAPTFVAPTGGLITVTGSNFGAVGDAVSVFVDDVKCTDAVIMPEVDGAANLTQTTHIRCRVRPGFGSGHLVSVLAAGQLSDPTPLLSYGFPTVLSAAVASSMANVSQLTALVNRTREPILASAGSDILVLSIVGHTVPSSTSTQNAATAPESFIRVWVGDRPCANVTVLFDWTTNADNVTKIACNAPRGHGSHIRVLTTVGTPLEPHQILSPESGVSASMLESGSVFVSYEGPMIEQVTPRFGPTGGGTEIHVRGKGFLSQNAGQQLATSVNQLHVAVGASPCVGVEILSDSELVCTVPTGIGACIPVVATFEDSMFLPRPSGPAIANRHHASASWTYSDTSWSNASSADDFDSVLAGSPLVTVDDTNSAAVLATHSTDGQSTYSLLLGCPRDCSACTAAAVTMAGVAQRLQCTGVTTGVLTTSALRSQLQRQSGAEGWPMVVFVRNGVPVEYLGSLDADSVAKWVTDSVDMIENVLATRSPHDLGTNASHILSSIFLRQPQSHSNRVPLYAGNCSNIV